MAGTDHGGVLFIGLSSYLSYTAQAHLPEDGIIHNGLGPPIPISNQKKKKGPTNRLTAQSDVGNSSIEVPLFPGMSRMFCSFETRSHATRSVLNLLILLPPFPEYWITGMWQHTRLKVESRT